MGTTADKIAGKIGSQLRSKIIDLSGLRAVKDIFEGAQLDSEGLKKLISKGHDPCHAVYIFCAKICVRPRRTTLRDEGDAAIRQNRR